MILLFLFIIGVCVGSFLNVVIDRIPNNRSILIDRSACDFCRHTLSWLDLIPVVSFVFLQGKCRYCHKKLSFQYPLIELTTGLLFLTVFFLDFPGLYILSAKVVIDILLVSCGFALFIMDIKYHILADKVLIAFGLLSLLRVLLFTPTLFLFSLEMGFLSCLPLLVLFSITKGRGMGFGDVKLAVIMGIVLLFPNIVVAYYLAFLTGAGSALILIVLGKKKLHGDTIAFGPFLLLGTFIAYWWGSQLWAMAIRMMGI